MKRVSTFTMAMALALGASGLTLATPAMAQGEPVYEEFSARNLSDAVRAQAGTIQTQLNSEETDLAVVRTALEAAEAAIENDDDRFLVGQYYIQLATKSQQAGASATDIAPLQQKGLQYTLDSNRSAVETRGQYWTILGSLSRMLDDEARAVTAYENALRYDPSNGDAAIQLAGAQFELGNADAGYAAANRAIEARRAAGQVVDISWISLPLNRAYQARNIPVMLNYGRQLVAEHPSEENWGNVLRGYQAVGGLDDQTNLDTMRLMRQTGSLDAAGYREYATLAAQRGLPGEALEVYNEGLGNGMTPDQAMLTEINSDIAGDRASLGESRSGAMAAATGRIALNTGDAYAAYGEYGDAISLYQLALQKGGIDAGTANLRLGTALLASNRTDEARAAFDAVTGSREGLANFWLTWMDQQAAPAQPEPEAAAASAE